MRHPSLLLIPLNRHHRRLLLRLLVAHSRTLLKLLLMPNWSHHLSPVHVLWLLLLLLSLHRHTLLRRHHLLRHHSYRFVISVIYRNVAHKTVFNSGLSWTHFYVFVNRCGVLICNFVTFFDKLFLSCFRMINHHAYSTAKNCTRAHHPTHTLKCF